jgi:hypothetical protein
MINSGRFGAWQCRSVKVIMTARAALARAILQEAGTAWPW